MPLESRERVGTSDPFGPVDLAASFAQLGLALLQLRGQPLKVFNVQGEGKLLVHTIGTDDP